MKKRKRENMTIQTSILLAALLLPSSPLLAEEANDTIIDRNLFLNPIVVTGTGYQEHLKETTVPVRVVTKAQLDQENVTTFSEAITKLIPQATVSPNGMGSQIRLNGMGNKYIVILINGRKITGDISGNVDLERINIARVRRIEVLDGAASILYGSDAIAGVINIITDQPTDELIAVENHTLVSGYGKLMQAARVDFNYKGFGSYSSYTHDRTGSYNPNGLEYVSGTSGETRQTIAPLYPGYHSDVFNQTFIYTVSKLKLHTTLDVTHKLTDRPNTDDNIVGGVDYEMRYRGERWNTGAAWLFDNRNSVLAEFNADWFRYGRFYDVAADSYAVGDFIESKRQQSYDAEVKGVLGLLPRSTTVIGADWRNDFLVSSAANVDAHVYTIAAYLQHEQEIADRFKVSLGLRYTYHQTFKNKFTPKLTLMYSPGYFAFRATYANGFRAPGLDELYYHYFNLSRGNAQITFGNRNLKAENSHYVSLNAEYRSDKLITSVTGFMNLVDNMIIRSSVEVDDARRVMLQREFEQLADELAAKLLRYGAYANSDKGRVTGLQVKVSYIPVSGLVVRGNYAWTYARTQSDGTWLPLERSVRNVVTLGANYSNTWGVYRMGIDLNARLQGKTYYPTYENAPGYGIWSINTTHHFTLRQVEWSPTVGIENIFDNVDKRIGSFTRRYALYSPGRTITVGLKIRWRK